MSKVCTSSRVIRPLPTQRVSIGQSENNKKAPGCGCGSKKVITSQNLNEMPTDHQISGRRYSRVIPVVAPEVSQSTLKDNSEIDEALKNAEFDYSVKPKRLLNFDEVFNDEKVLGKGGFGEVHLVTSKLTGKPFALKFMLQPDPEMLEEEIGALKKISAYPYCKKNIVCYYDAFSVNHNGKDTFAILSEFIEGEDLDQYLRDHNKKHLDANEVLRIAKWLIPTIAELHRMGYVHRDIKPNNIMITSDGTFKLIDFGLTCLMSEYLDEDGKVCKGDISGTPGYLAPEIYDGYFQADLPKYYRTADVYAVGMTLYDLLEGHLAYDEDRRKGREGYPLGEFIPITKSHNVCLNNLIQEMVEKNPDNRPTIFEAEKEIEKC